MNKSLFLILTTLFAITLFSCSEKEATSTPTSPTQELQFEVVDSIMVDVLEDLVILDYQDDLDQYLMKERRGGKVFIVNGKGEMIEEVALAGEGPNQVSMIWEGRFLGKDRFIFKELSATMDFHLFDRDFLKIEKIKGPAVGLNAIFVSFYRQTFSIWNEDGKDFILGEEVNSYNPADADPDKIGGEFYNQVKTGYFYDLDRDSITYLNLYPEAWVPRTTKRWIGQSFPFLTFDTKRNKAAILPPMGDQLFLYDLEGNSLINEKSVKLSHPDRDQEIPDVSREYLLYPSFSDVKSFGEYHLAIFYTAIPEDVYNEYRSKGENYQQDPEYRKAHAKHRNPRYIVVKGDLQIGILNELPVEGNVNLGLPDGTLIVKAADGEVERDYNLFYEIRLVEE
ncbi:hypothetical protein SYJ56_16115 [Algoriphagus sp. D3-2-R+10]|uniref:hypothetical protein n=1 Tax=Algoriphagus aurantiacus TaxID=3103948 RepID=UPI002B3C039C|nr:hypothetical protein [Algoriphagus sp. D3-2-R+10]MEB2776853.1 hypothetical protein [Algoriphagus sp. D3-2-R+10]